MRLTRPLPIWTTTSPAPSQTKRCRHRRRAASATRLTSQRTYNACLVARTPATSAARVSPGVRTSARPCSTHVSSTSTKATVPVSTTTPQATTTRALRPSHHLPEALRWAGRGGGSPEGRRRLRTRWMAGGSGRSIGTAWTGSGGACGSDAMPADAPPGPVSRAPPFVPLRRYGCPPVPPAREEALVRPRPAGMLAVLTLLLVVVGCSPDAGDQATPTTAASTIRFASYDFPENQTLVEVYAQAARRAGLPVSVEHGVGPRGVVAPALQQGVVDVVIDYLGTALRFARPTATDLPSVPAEMHAVLMRTLGGRGVTVLDPAPAEDQNGFAVTAGFAGEHGVRRLSDLRALAATLTFGAPPECPDRPLCLPGLEKTYGLHFRQVRAMPSRAATVEALLAGEIDV